MEARRVMIYGVTGSGKSTLARRLGSITGLPVIPVDDLTWCPGWTPVPGDQQRMIMTEVCAQDSWIIDAGYGKWTDIVWERVQLIIGLDYPRWLSLGRLIRRTVARVVRRTPTCNGNVETLRLTLARDSIIRWHFRSWARKRRRMRGWQEAQRAGDGGPQVLLFTRPAELERWLATQRQGPVRSVAQD